MKTICFPFAIFLLAFIGLRHLDRSGFILYQGIALGTAIALGQFLHAKLKRIETRQAFKDAMLTFLLAYAFVFTIPTTVDRSYSVKMITMMANSPQGLTREQVNHLYIAYFIEQGGAEKRLQEQQATKTLYEDNGKYSLTRWGQILNWLFHAAQVLFACEQPTT